MEFQQVLRMTALRYRSGTPIRSDLDQDTDLDELMDDAYFSYQSGGDDWYVYDGILDNSEDDIQDDEEETEEENAYAGARSETWNLVDVMPSFGQPNGEGESIFQLGATIVPGVIGMIGGRTMMGMSNNNATNDGSSQSSAFYLPRRLGAMQRNKGRPF